ncbi:hypothetical protein D0Z03_000806 [Geotrichum reessii]|nr:hypothetical protein D0Z03_000806 [Galactomyces reessii]
MNQVNSISSQASQASQKKEQAEGELAKVLAIKADLQSRLSSLRSEYDAQIKKSTEAQQLLHTTKNDTEKLTSEYSILEASYHAVKSQCQELSNQLVADQQKNAELKDKIRFLNEETAGLKQTLEKLQKEVKQQSGFVSINKKQFAFAESERDKIKTQISQTQESITRDALSPGISESSPIPGFTSIGSSSRVPSVSSPISSTNPFLSSFSQPVNQPVTFNETAAAPFNATFEDRFNQLGISSPTTTVEPARSSTHNTADTPNSSPPSSDFQYYPNNAPIPSFTLPLGRPESTTSSVQNNPSMSVRGDIDISRPDSPEMTVNSEPVSGVLPSEELAERGTNFSTSQLPIPPDSLNPINDQTLRQSSALEDSINSGSGSFEIVPHHTEDSINPLSSNSHISPSSESIETAKNVIGSSGLNVPDVSSSVPQNLLTNNEISTSQDDRTQLDSTVGSTKSIGGNTWPVAPKSTSEFPPIKELEYDDDSSSSDDEEVKNTAATIPPGSSPSVSATVAPSITTNTTTQASLENSGTSAQGIRAPSFMINPKEPDSFEAAFDGLEEAKEESVSVNAFVNSPFVVNSNSNTVPASSSNTTSQAHFANSSISAPPVQNTSILASNGNSKEADPFDAAFDKLEQAQEEAIPVSTFSNSPFAAGSRAPSVISQTVGSPQQTHGFSFSSVDPKAALPVSSKPSVLDSFPIDSPASQVNPALASKDEWDSIFAGFGSENASKPAASANDINNAFGAVADSQQQL